jgi:molecular chaperone GrpE
MAEANDIDGQEADAEGPPSVEVDAELEAGAEGEVEGEAEGGAEASEDPPGVVEIPIADLKLELEAARLRAADFKDKLLRAAADMANYRQRASREQQEARRFAIEGLLKDLLPVVDNFERAIEHATTDDDEGAAALVDGVTMVQRQLLDVVAKFGVRPFESLGKPFDPKLHEAISSQETADAEPGTVIQEFQRGFMIHDRLARAAMVIVAAAPSEAAEAEAEVEAHEPEGGDAGEGAAAEAEAAADVEAGSDAPPLDFDAIPGPRVESMGVVVAGAPQDLLGYHGLDAGVVVTELRERTPAARSELKLGDVVVGAGGRPVKDPKGFQRSMRVGLQRAPTVALTVRRQGASVEEVLLGSGRN